MSVEHLQEEIELAKKGHQKSPSAHTKNPSTLTADELSQIQKWIHDPQDARNRAKSLHRNPVEDDNDDIDRIERYLQHLQYCCKIYSGFDIYQLLAFRRYHKPSRKWTKTKPFKLLGSRYELHIHSPYMDAIVTAIVIGLLQVVGISVILAETVTDYFDHNDGKANCEAEIEFWIEDGIFKILAMLFAAMISIQLNKTIQSQRHSGFNELLSSIDENDFGKLSFIDIAMVQLGLLINVYTLFCAVIGSFFLIYASEAGSESLDMVLNSISLFFMVGLDDLLVSTNDYEDVEDFILECYDKYIENKLSIKDNIDVQTCGYSGLICCDRFVDTIQFVLVSLTYIGGVLAPIVIAVCW